MHALTLALLLAATDGPAPPEPSWARPVAHSAALLVGMQISLAVLWPGTYDLTRFADDGRQFRLAYDRPPEFRRDRRLFESDGDPWALNVVGHGLFGSEVFLRTRQCGHGIAASIAATAAVSTAWEYGVEAFSKRPSAVDLAWTPVGGSLLGELRYRVHRWSRRGDGSRARAIVSWIVDPLGEAERAALGGC